MCRKEKEMSREERDRFLAKKITMQRLRGKSNERHLTVEGIMEVTQPQGVTSLSILRN